MYQRILVPVEHSDNDQVILRHVRKLARTCNDASIVLIHVADGWAARNIKQLDLRESEEMREDREYLERVAAGFVSNGVKAEAVLATGDPATEVTAAADREHCDLIAMATHGHKLIGDVIHGSVANSVRHKSMVPVLLVRAPGKPAA
jgi:universal stress protein A